MAQDGTSQGYIIKSSAAGLYGICMLNYFRCFQTAFQKGYATLVLISHAQGCSVNCPHP